MYNKLKSEKGITLISLIVYVIVMLVVVTIIGTITSYFYANVNNQYTESKDENNENVLNMYLAKDLKNREISITDLESNDINVKTDETQEETEDIKVMNLIYNDGSNIVYTITGDGIYRNLVKIYNKESNNMHFELWDIDSEKKVELRIIETVENVPKIFKSYIVNIK